VPNCPTTTISPGSRAERSRVGAVGRSYVVAMEPTRFAIRYSTLNRFALTLMGMGPARSGIWVGPDSVRVVMGWGFRAELPRGDLRQVDPGDVTVLNSLGGVHGWDGRWIVSGAADGLVRFDLAPEARAHVMGISVRLASLRVSVETAAGLTSALSPAAV